MARLQKSSTFPSPPMGESLQAAPPSIAFLERFEIVRELGRGGMGVVLLARQKSLDRLVAVKMLNTAHTTAASLLVRFRREAANLVRLKHPNLVRLYDFDLNAPEPYLVIELVEGDRSLEDLIDSGDYSRGDALRLCLELLSGVAYLHEHGVLHRDTKPANILIDPHGHARLADFGLSRDTDPGSTRATADGQIIGTLNYMPPEIPMGDAAKAGGEADVYSLGLVLHEVLARKPIWEHSRFHGGKPLCRSAA